MKNKINQKRTIWAIAIVIITGCLNFLLLSNSTFSQIVFIVQFCCLLIAFALNCYSTKYLILVFIACILSVINSMINGSGYGTVIIFINLILSFSILVNTAIEGKYLQKLDILIFVLLIFILVFFSKKVDAYYISWFSYDTRINPNGYATIVLTCGMLANIIISKSKIKSNFIRTIISISSFIIFFIVIYKTGARTSLGCYLIYELLCAFYFVFYRRHNRRFKDKTVLKGILFSLFISFAVVGVYMLLYQILDADFTIMGKRLFSGRQIIWHDAFDQIKNNLIFGISNSYLFAGKFLNAHNGFISILSYFGIVPFIMFLCIIYKSFTAAPSKNGFNYNVYKCFAIAVFFIVSTFEAFILDGTFYFLMLPFLLNKEKDNDTKDNSLLLVR